MRHEPGSPDFAAVRHILQSPLIDARCAPFIHEEDFDWEGLFAEAETMSGGERVLLRIAYDLWQPTGIAGIWEVPRRLDRRNFERVVEALSICRDGMAGSVSEPELDAA